MIKNQFKWALEITMHIFNESNNVFFSVELQSLFDKNETKRRLDNHDVTQNYVINNVMGK